MAVDQVILQRLATIQQILEGIYNNAKKTEEFPEATLQELEQALIRISVNGVSKKANLLALSNQNNVGRDIRIIREATGSALTETEVAAIMTTTTRTITEIQTPVLVTIVAITTTAEGEPYVPPVKYIYLFIAGKGVYGPGGTTITGSMLRYLATQNATPEDIEGAGGNTSVIPLGTIPDGDYLTVANSADRDFSDPDINYFIKYTTDGTSYILLAFTGTPGLYGGSNPDMLTAEDFQPAASDDAPPAVSQNMQETNDTGNTIAGETAWQDENGNAAIIEAKGFNIKNNGYQQAIRFDELTEDSGVIEFPATVGTDKVAYQGYVDGVAGGIVDGASSDYDTLGKIATKLAAVVAIIGQGENDGDTFVNTVEELLQVFQNFPEGTDVAQVLAGKVNVSDIVNNLTQTTSGKVLDARQGKALNDLITALTTTVGTKLTGMQATDAETQITAAVTEDNKFVSRSKLFNWWAWVKGQAQTIVGVFTFNTSPLVPDVTYGDNSTKAANTKFVQGAVSAINSNFLFNNVNSTPSATLTGSTGQVILKSIPIPAGTFKNGSFYFYGSLGAVGIADTKIITAVLSPNASSVSGGVQIGQLNMTVPQISAPFQRNFSISGIDNETDTTAVIKGYPFNANATLPAGSSLPLGSATFNPTVQQYLHITGQLYNASDSVYLDYIETTIKKSN